MLSQFCLISILHCLARAHFFIDVPTPFPVSAVKDPLIASGSNFPCHGADLSNPTTRTAMKVGETRPLGFNLGNGANTAVHGGGSCQISITYETDPAKLKDPGNWKVIKSFIGGCPTNAKGNLPTAMMCNGKNSPECVNALSFSIPPEVKNGDAVLAWTWFNNVGEREMYMNCAAVSFSGGQNQTSLLPDMFVANLGEINQCATTEDFNTDFPDPGWYIQKEDSLNYPLKAPVGTGCQKGSRFDLLTSNASSDMGREMTKAPITAVLTKAPGKFLDSSVQSPKPVKKFTSRCQFGQIECSSVGFFCITANQYGICDLGCALSMSMSRGTSCVDNTISFAKNAMLRMRGI